MKIVLVRHGQTEENFEGNICGLNNEMMNDTGRRQCQRLKEKLKDIKFDFCYMSPLIRCVESAIILVGDRVETAPDKRLIDRDMKDLVGKSRDDINEEDYWNLECKEVESVEEMFERCKSFLDYIKEKHKDESIIIVTHGSIYRVLRHIILNHDMNNLYDGIIPNCHYEEFDF